MSSCRRRFADPPGDSDIDLVVVGESSAKGIPYQAWLSIGRLVAWKLQEAIPGAFVRVQILANSGDTLELQHQRLARLDRRPDLLIVYSGHNEFGSRLNGARDLPHYVDDRAPGAWRLVREQVEAVSPLCELIRQASEKCRLELPPAPGGDRDLVDRPAYTPGEYALLLADFRRRLDAIATYAGRVGATAVFLIPPGNDAGFEPNRSFLPAETPRAIREAFRRDFLEARRLEGVNPAAATAAYRALVARQPGFAEAHYRLGLLLDRNGDEEGAYRHFIAARDLDGYPIRCTVAFQDVYREIAARHDVILVDGQAELHAIGDRGQLDDHLFQDAMHPSLRGQIALAQAILRSLRAHAHSAGRRGSRRRSSTRRDARITSAWTARRGRPSASGESTSEPTRSVCATIRPHTRGGSAPTPRLTIAWSPGRRSSRWACPTSGFPGPSRPSPMAIRRQWRGAIPLESSISRGHAAVPPALPDPDAGAARLGRGHRAPRRHPGRPRVAHAAGDPPGPGERGP